MILATIMWAGSAMHSTVNFGQYDYSVRRALQRQRAFYGPR